ncbi:bifunctional RNA cap guanine-N2 methyltransferase/S-adenosyl-L-methionine-dependent methyltransferase superfamily [Babesia duncani]|uniref:Trimethylguanosine synthase n=1 Tax=Babesia duncani TaxID=323732 RepID=A0AAD9PJ96_9APIC|nr:bifunctional RNA cap guanine-N2 methyltransferase/S-adenosyl-L-methionine-dependent methyltransferase superfamily [Babesia duncani]
MESPEVFNSTTPYRYDLELIQRHYNKECVYDVRFDGLDDNVLYLITTVGENSRSGPPSSSTIDGLHTDPSLENAVASARVVDSPYPVAVHAAFVVMNLVQGTYKSTLPVPNGSTPESDAENLQEKSEYIRRNIFWNDSPDLKLDSDALFDASWEGEARHEAQVILEYLHAPRKWIEFEEAFLKTNGTIGNDTHCYHGTRTRVVDLTCGIGGNLVQFAQTFDFVVGLDLNPDRIEMARNNLSIYNVVDKAVLVQTDLFEWCGNFIKDPKAGYQQLGRLDMYQPSTFPFDWTFISPPWGGRKYKGSFGYGAYYLQDECCLDIYRLVELISQMSKNFTLLVPKSQSVAELVRLASKFGYLVLSANGYVAPSHNRVRVCLKYKSPKYPVRLCSLYQRL